MIILLHHNGFIFCLRVLVQQYIAWGLAGESGALWILHIDVCFVRTYTQLIMNTQSIFGRLKSRANLSKLRKLIYRHPLHATQRTAQPIPCNHIQLHTIPLYSF